MRAFILGGFFRVDFLASEKNWNLTPEIYLNFITLSFLSSFLGIPLFFRLLEIRCFFLSGFPFFSRDFWDLVEMKNPSFFGGFPGPFPKKARTDNVEPCLSLANLLVTFWSENGIVCKNA